MHDEGFLITERAGVGAFGDGVGHPAGQGANPAVREKYFRGGDWEFVVAEFLIREDFFQRHGSEFSGK